MATKKALIVGIDNYYDPADALTCCVNDGNAVARLLKTTYGFADIHTLRDQEATLARVGEELGWLARDAKADDRLVFYFSGNGCTRAADGIVEECLALHDGAFEGSQLVSATRDIAPGTLTVIIDACFTGASEEFALDPMSSVPEVETAKVKVLKQATRDGRARSATDGPTKVTELRRFACSAITSPPAIARMLSTSPLAARIPQETYATMPSWYAAATSTAGTAEPELNGLALLACLEHERAAANTSKTKGLSAFTHALITSVEKLGNAATTAELTAVTAERLRALGFNQTPRIMERAFPGDLKLRRFVTLEQATATETLRFLSEPRFWEGVFTALAPQLSVARAVQSREGEMMSTMYQQTPNPFPQAFTPYQPTFSTSPHFQDDIQRITPLLAPVLATIIPAIVPQVVNTILAQQRTGQMGGYAAYGYAPTPSFAQQPNVGALGTPFATDDAQRIWPVLAPVLANVIAAVLPAVVNNIVIAQQQQQQQQQRSAYGLNGPATSPELWHTVNQSVNETLQRFGAPTPNLAGFQTPFSAAPRA